MDKQAAKPESATSSRKHPAPDVAPKPAWEQGLSGAGLYLQNAAAAAVLGAGDPLDGQARLLKRGGLGSAQQQALAAHIASAYGNYHLQRVITSDVRRPDVVQRDGEAAGRIDRLDEMLDRFNVPEEDVITILGQLDDTEKATVLNPERGYKQKVADALNVEEMIRAVNGLRPPLVTKLEWVWAAATITASIDYSEIRGMITDPATSQTERNDVAPLKSFFVSVCDNATMLQAVKDLGFSLVNQLDWIRAELTSVRAELNYSDIKDLVVAGVGRGEQNALKTDEWRGFFVQVCTNETMVEALGDLQFDLVTKLQWLRDELISVRVELSYATVQPMITAAEQPERDALKTNEWRTFFVQTCDNETIVTACDDLGWDLATRWDWYVAEGRDFTVDPAELDGSDLEVRQGIKDNPAVMSYLRGAMAPVDFWRVQLILEYGTEIGSPSPALALLGQLRTGESAVGVRNLFTRMSEDDFTALQPVVGVEDVLTGVYGSEAEPLVRLIRGEPIAETQVSEEYKEELEVGEPVTGTFTPRTFTGLTGFDVALQRTQVLVTVRVALVATNATAQAQLPAAQAAWHTNIEAAWNVYNLTNGDLTIPLRFDLVFTNSNPHHTVQVHPNAPAPKQWPAVDEGNWWAQELTSPNHEFGHMIGNPDEYFLSAEHFAETVGYNPQNAPAGQVVTEQDIQHRTRYAARTMMGAGGRVEPRHLNYFLNFVNEHRMANEPEWRLVR